MWEKLQISKSLIEKEFVKKVEELSGQNLYLCYQCGKCSAGCPMADKMDFLPNNIIRLLQLGCEEVLDSKTPWICASCFTCAVRCPRGVNIAKLMEALRLLRLRKNIDFVKISEISADLPQIAVVSSFRKFTG